MTPCAPVSVALIYPIVPPANQLESSIINKCARAVMSNCHKHCLKKRKKINREKNPESCPSSQGKRPGNLHSWLIYRPAGPSRNTLQIDQLQLRADPQVTQERFHQLAGRLASRRIELNHAGINLLNDTALQRWLCPAEQLSQQSRCSTLQNPSDARLGFDIKQSEIKAVDVSDHPCAQDSDYSHSVCWKSHFHVWVFLFVMRKCEGVFTVSAACGLLKQIPGVFLVCIRTEHRITHGLRLGKWVDSESVWKWFRRFEFCCCCCLSKLLSWTKGQSFSAA